MSLDHKNMAETATIESAVEPELLRAVAGTFATGISIITCAADGKPQGCAANAILSVSLDPALMLISLARTSRTRAAIERAGAFGINILPDNPDGVALCSLFAGRAENKFAWVQYRAGMLGTPILRDALGWLECAVETVHIAADHALFVGRVVDAGHEAGEPLIFFRGRHRRLAA